MPKTRLEFGGLITPRMMHKLCSFLAENPINPGDGDEFEDDGSYEGQTSSLTERERYALHRKWMETILNTHPAETYSVVMDDDFEVRFGPLQPTPLWDLSNLCSELGLAWRYQSLGGVDDDFILHDHEVTLGGAGVPLKGTCGVNGSGFAMLPIRESDEFDALRIEAMIALARRNLTIVHWKLPPLRLIKVEGESETAKGQVVRRERATPA